MSEGWSPRSITVAMGRSIERAIAGDRGGVRSQREGEPSNGAASVGQRDPPSETDQPVRRVRPRRIAQPQTGATEVAGPVDPGDRVSDVPRMGEPREVAATGAVPRTSRRGETRLPALEFGVGVGAVTSDGDGAHDVPFDAPTGGGPTDRESDDIRLAHWILQRGRCRRARSSDPTRGN